MFLELAIGDAYGACFEFAPIDFVKSHNNLTGYKRRPKNNKPAGIKKVGYYTDDTQMSLAVWRAIENFGSAIPTKEYFAHAFVAQFKSDPRLGYASMFYALLNQVSDGDELLQKIIPVSDRAGSSMRACPIGIYKKPEKVMKVASIQARITHNTPDGVVAAQTAAMMSHFFLYGKGSKTDLPRYLDHYLPGNWSMPWDVTKPVGNKGMEAVRAALTAIMNGQTMAEVLFKTVDYTGDVDTVAAIALGCIAHSAEFADDLPIALYDRLENNLFGRDYLKLEDETFLATLDVHKSRVYLPPLSEHS